MSQQGIQLAAEAFTFLQQKSYELMKLGAQDNVMKTQSGQQDILLARMLDGGKDAMKYIFEKLTVMDIGEPKVTKHDRNSRRRPSRARQGRKGS